MPRSVAHGLVVFAFAVAAAGCGKGTTSTVPSASASASASAAPVAAAPAKPESGGLSVESSGGGIAVKVKSVQLFHPYASGRALPAAKDDGTFDGSGGGGTNDRFGVGVVVEAENGGAETLSDPSVTGAFVFRGPHGEIACELETVKTGYDGPRFLAYVAATDGAAGKWKNDVDSEIEAPWRPGERIRMIARNDKCESITLLDLAPAEIALSFKVIAHRRFLKSAIMELDHSKYELTIEGATLRIVDRATHRVAVVGVGAIIDSESLGREGAQLSRVKLYRALRAGDPDLVTSAPVEIPIDAHALTLQKLTLVDGSVGFGAGNIVFYAKDGAPAVGDLAKLGLSLDSVARADLPSASPPVDATAEELTARVTTMKLAVPAEDASIERGKHRLTVTWSFAIAGSKVAARLGEKAEGAGGERALKAERIRVAKLLGCDAIQLVTTKTTRGAANKGDAAKTCSALDTVDSIEVVLKYDLERYEIPVALAYSVGKTKTWTAIASVPLAKLDPR